MMKWCLVLFAFVAVAVCDPPQPPDYGNYSTTFYSFMDLDQGEFFGSSGSGQQEIDYTTSRARYQLNYYGENFAVTVLAFYDEGIQYFIVSGDGSTECFSDEIREEMYPADYLQTECHYAGEGEVFDHYTHRWACPATKMDSVDDTYFVFYLWTDINPFETPRRESFTFLASDGSNIGTFVMDVLTYSTSKPSSSLWDLPSQCTNAQRKDYRTVIPKSKHNALKALSTHRL